MSNKEIAIKVENLSKKYEIGKEKDGSLRGTLANLFKSRNSTSEEFWALKDINFEINKGDVIGIIGKNGAGKSTLLKILSQITSPTTGRIEINGRVASLLEVGTGFHPELTGRENIFLNGTILGMTRKEVKAKFNEIVEFSGVEKFIDTPVKHYSSGMYVRLAFAVAAHLEPEILIIDEVLAVGDASFQKKCLGKMEDLASQGRTVIFVSHDLGAVSSLCNKGILLHQGRIEFVGKIEDTVNKYTSPESQNSDYSKNYKDVVCNETDGHVVLKNIKLIDKTGTVPGSIFLNQEFGVEVVFEVNEGQNIKPIPNLHLFHNKGGRIFVTVDDCEHHTYSKAGVYTSTVWFPANFFNSGIFVAGIAISTLDPVQVHVADYDAISFEVLDALDAPTRNGYTGKFEGYLRPKLNWNNRNLEK